MHYTLSYKDIPQDEADKKAIEDAIFYNEKGVQVVEKAIAEKQITNFTQLEFYLSFAGIQGYPVQALARKHGIEITA